MDYLYGNLNKLVELQKYKFTSSDNTILTLVNDENYVDLSANTQQLVTLKLSKVENSIKYYRLFAYNSDTKLFDIPLGDEIIVGEPSNSGGMESIDSAWVIVGEYQKMEPVLGPDGLPTFDPETGIQIMTPVYDENGAPVMVPIYHKIEASINSEGQLKLGRIPASAIVDYTLDENNNPIYIESVIDGNAGGKVY